MRYIDQNEIYNQTEQGLKIFKYYFPNEDFSNLKHYFKVRPEEKSSSSRVSWFNNLWRITDFGNQGEVKGMTAIEFVKWRDGYSHYDALRFIEEVIIGRKVEGGNFKPSKFAAEYSSREVTPEDKKGDYHFTYKTEPSKSDLSVIGRYVTKDHLDVFCCKSVEKYEYVGQNKDKTKDIVHIYTATDDYPIFLFDYGDFKKLYKPLEPKKEYRFLYIGKKPAKFIYGYKQLLKCRSEFLNKNEEEYTGDESNDEDTEEVETKPEGKPKALVVDLFRCSGESDALNLYSLGFHVYWLNSESEDFDYDTFKQVDDLCKNHYQIMDLDNTGRAQAMTNAMKHISLYSIELPEWLRLKDDWRGNSCKDLKDFINLSGTNVDVTRYNFRVLKNNARRVKFWQRVKDKNREDININMEYFYFFLRASGFFQMESKYFKKAGYCYVHIHNKLVELISPDDIKRRVKRYTKEWIKSKNIMEGLIILNKINTSAQLTESNLESIDEIKCNFKNYDSSTEYLHFKNCSIKITADKIERIKQDEVPNHIIKELVVDGKRLSQLINRNVQLIAKPIIQVEATPEFAELLAKQKNAKTDEERGNIFVEINKMSDIEKYIVTVNDEDFIFAGFLRNISRLHWRKELELKQPLTEIEKKEEMLALANIMFVLGYHCAQYKDSGKPWLTLLQDLKISDVGEASGRSGKSLLSKAIAFVRIAFYKGGRSLTDKSVFQFFYEGLTEFHDFIEIDDLHEFADFAFFYTQITGKREVNSKNYPAFTLDYPDSGKMLISTNYELPNTNSSTLSRLLNCGTTDYYHESTKFNDYKETRSPKTEYGRNLYDDFTDEEWQKFYNLICYCIQLQMRFYKIQPPMGSLEKRQLRRQMSSGLGRDEEFFNWANDYFITLPVGDTFTEISPEDHGYFNTYIIKEKAFENFTSRLSSKQKNDYRSTKFKAHLQCYCEYFEYELNPEDRCTDKAGRRILKTIDGGTLNRPDKPGSRTVECFYISNTPPPQRYDNKSEETVISESAKPSLTYTTDVPF